MARIAVRGQALLTADGDLAVFEWLSATFQSVPVEIHKRRALKIAKKIVKDSRDQPS